MRLLVAILLIGSTAASEPVHTSSCNPTTSERTHWGNLIVQIDAQKKPLRFLWGTVYADDQPVDRTLIEVYVLPGNDPPRHQIDQQDSIENRICACVTGAAGNFAFDLPPGRYEIRSSKADWKTTSVLVVIKHRGKNTATKIPLEVGT
jgi:hypothetical protein